MDAKTLSTGLGVALMMLSALFFTLAVCALWALLRALADWPRRICHRRKAMVIRPIKVPPTDETVLNHRVALAEGLARGSERLFSAGDPRWRDVSALAIQTLDNMILEHPYANSSRIDYITIGAALRSATRTLWRQ